MGHFTQITVQKCGSKWNDTGLIKWTGANSEQAYECWQGCSCPWCMAHGSWNKLEFASSLTWSLCTDARLTPPLTLLLSPHTTHNPRSCDRRTPAKGGHPSRPPDSSNLFERWKHCWERGTWGSIGSLDANQSHRISSAFISSLQNKNMLWLNCDVIDTLLFSFLFWEEKASSHQYGPI